MDRYGKRTGVTNVSLPELPAEKQLRYSRLGRELRLTDQILSDDLDTVSIVMNGPAPAWTDMEGDHVSFAVQFMPYPDSKLHLAVWLGTNAHELGHVLFTPRKDSPLVQRILAAETSFMRGIASLHNIVEDQRQERLILGRFAPWRGYLTAALAHHLQGDTDSSWLLMAGRTWLPDDVRAAARAAFVKAQGEWMASEVSRLIGDYQHLTDPGDTESDEAWGILDRLYELLGQNVPPQRHRCSEVGGTGQPDTSPASDDAPPSADEADSPSSGPPSKGDKPDDDDAQSADGDASDSDDSADEGDSTGNAPADGDDKSSDDGDTPGGNGAGTGTTDPMSPEAMRDALDKAAVDQIDSDADASDDIANVLDSLAHGRVDEDSTGDDAAAHYIDASESARALHYDVADALLDLKDESEPGWVRRTDSGRLNVRRVIANCDPEDAFDRYDPGVMDASNMAVVLLLDVSISMRGQNEPLAEATWAIRRAVDDIEGICTVLTWSDGPIGVLATASDRPDDRMRVPHIQGGTNPREALNEAYRLLAASDARNRLVVILTDGDWTTAGNERVIDAMNDVGITTVLAHLGELPPKVDYAPDGERIVTPGNIDTHHCRYARNINELTELPRLFRDVAVERIGAWL